MFKRGRKLELFALFAGHFRPYCCPQPEISTKQYAGITGSRPGRKKYDVKAKG